MAPSDDRHIIAVADTVELAKVAANRVAARIAANDRRIAICLTGGSSPRQLYEMLGMDPCKSNIPWERVHWFIGDERFVPADDPLNNMNMARQIFLNRCAPAANIHPIATDAANPDEAARRYEATLRSFYGAEDFEAAKPLFDLVLLGIGTDGHVASLFPGYRAIAEQSRWVVGVPEAHVAPFVPRVTLTLPALCSCREMLFEVAGSDKRGILTRVLSGEDLPANRVRATGETVWLLDQAALPESFRGR